MVALDSWLSRHEWGTHGSYADIRELSRSSRVGVAAAVRATTLLNRLLDLPGISMQAAALGSQQLTVDVRLRSAKLGWPVRCAGTRLALATTPPVPSFWRGLDSALMW